MLLQQLQLWSSRKSHRLWSYQQSRCCGHRSSHLLQNSPLVLDDPTISQTVMPQRDHRSMDAFCCWQGGGPPSRIWGHHQHHQRWDRMRQGIQWQGGRPHWLLQEVLWLAWSQLWLQPWLLQPKEFWCFNQPPCCFILMSYYLNSNLCGAVWPSHCSVLVIYHEGNRSLCYITCLSSSTHSHMWVHGLRPIVMYVITYY